MPIGARCGPLTYPDSVLALACALAFLLGSVPFALLLVRFVARKDIRTIGSGNVGATNASRAFGKPWRLPAFLSVYIFDAGKGFAGQARCVVVIDVVVVGVEQVQDFQLYPPAVV